MRYIISFIILTILTVVHAKESYPKLFAKQGTPLYKVIESFSALDKASAMKIAIDDYTLEAKETKKLGFKADESKEKDDIKIYFKSLRMLQSTHDKLIGLSTKILYKATKNDNYKEFKSMVDFGILYYEKKPKLREYILTYYKKNRKKSKINSLEKMLRYDRSVTKQYDETEYVFSQDFQTQEPGTTDKKIILLSMNGCSWCGKVKKLLDDSGKSYRELNVKNSEGSRLFKKYNGKGVPMLIVDNIVIRGYSPNKILDAIE